MTITNRDTGQQGETTSNESGSYSFPELQAGTYDLKITQAGFETFSRTGVLVTINNVVRVDARMEVGAVRDSLTVTAEAALLQTDRSDVSAQLAKQELREPLGGYGNYQSC